MLEGGLTTGIFLRVVSKLAPLLRVLVTLTIIFFCLFVFLFLVVLEKEGNERKINKQKRAAPRQRENVRILNKYAGERKKKR